MTIKKALIHDCVLYIPELIIVFWICILIIFGVVYEKSRFHIRLVSALSNMSCIVFTLLTLNYVYMLFKGQSKIAVAEIDVIEDMDEADPPMC